LFEIYRFGAKWPSDTFRKEPCIDNLLAGWKRGRVIGYKSGRDTNQKRFLDYVS
jgi:hypothetical protein